MVCDGRRQPRGVPGGGGAGRPWRSPVVPRARQGVLHSSAPASSVSRPRCSELPGSGLHGLRGLHVSCSPGVGTASSRAPARRRLPEERGGTANTGDVYPERTSYGSSWWVYGEGLTPNLLIRTNYAKIALKPRLIDDIQQWEFL